MNVFKEEFTGYGIFEGMQVEVGATMQMQMRIDILYLC